MEFYLEYEVKDFCGRRFLIPLRLRTEYTYNLLVVLRAIKHGLTEQFEYAHLYSLPTPIYDGTRDYIQKRVEMNKAHRSIILDVLKFRFLLIQPDINLTNEQNFGRLYDSFKYRLTDNSKSITIASCIVVPITAYIMFDAGASVDPSDILVIRVILPDINRKGGTDGKEAGNLLWGSGAK